MVSTGNVLDPPARTRHPSKTSLLFGSYLIPLDRSARLPVMPNLVGRAFDIKIKPPVHVMSVTNLAVPPFAPQVATHRAGPSERPYLTKSVASNLSLDSNVHQIT